MRYLFTIIFLLTALLALAATPKYEEAGMAVFENPSDISNSIFYFGLIIAFTAFILVAAKWKKIIAVIIYSLTLISIYYILLPFAGFISLLVAILLVTMLVKKPNWLVINVSALLLSAGIASIFGISLEPLPVIILLAILAAYDAISVYKTKHMVTLAESVAGLKVPMLFVIPRKDGNAYMGVGDAVMPNILVVSAQYFTNSPQLYFIKIPALFALIGSLMGLVILLTIVEKKGGAHPGLPFLNGGAIIGFAASFLVV
jgi:presenilin-like A22 family membrane protease